MPKRTDALLLRDRLRVCTPFTTQTLQAHPLREKRCLQFKKLRWISISHPRVSSASSAKTAGAPPGSPACLPELSPPCLVIYVYTDLLHISEGRMRLPHRWYFRERKGWGSKSSSAGTMEEGCFSWPRTSCVALRSVQKLETADSWEDSDFCILSPSRFSLFLFK